MAVRLPSKTGSNNDSHFLTLLEDGEMSHKKVPGPQEASVSCVWLVRGGGTLYRPWYGVPSAKWLISELGYPFCTFPYTAALLNDQKLVFSLRILFKITSGTVFPRLSPAWFPQAAWGTLRPAGHRWICGHHWAHQPPSQGLSTPHLPSQWQVHKSLCPSLAALWIWDISKSIHPILGTFPGTKPSPLLNLFGASVLQLPYSRPNSPHRAGPTQAQPIRASSRFFFHSRFVLCVRGFNKHNSLIAATLGLQATKAPAKAESSYPLQQA